MSNGLGHDLEEVVVAVCVGGRTGQLHDRKVCLVDGIKRVAYLADDIAHCAESGFKLDGVLDARLEVHLNIGVMHRGFARHVGGVGAETKSFGLPVGAVIESQLVGFLKGNAVVVAVLAFLHTVAAVNGKDTGGIHTVVDILHKAGDDGIHTVAVDLEGISHPLTGGLPLIAAYRVEHCAGGVGRTCHRGRAILDRINGGRGCLIGDLGLKLYDVGARGGIFVLLAVFLISRKSLDGEKSDLLYRHRLVDRLEGYGVLARLENELERIGIEAVNVAQLIIAPFGRLLHGGTELVVVNIRLERTIDAASYVVHAHAADNGVIVYRGPYLREGYVVRLREGDLTVNKEGTLYRRCLALNGIILDGNTVLRRLRNIEAVHYRALVGSIERLNTVIGLFFDLGVGLLFIVIKTVDHDVALSARIFRLVRVLRGVLVVA